MGKINDKCLFRHGGRKPEDVLGAKMENGESWKTFESLVLVVCGSETNR